LRDEAVNRGDPGRSLVPFWRHYVEGSSSRDECGKHEYEDCEHVHLPTLPRELNDACGRNNTRIVAGLTGGCGKLLASSPRCSISNGRDKRGHSANREDAMIFKERWSQG